VTFLEFECVGCGKNFRCRQGSKADEDRLCSVCFEKFRKGEINPHIHRWEIFEEKGCVDDDVYEVCSCGVYKLLR